MEEVIVKQEEPDTSFAINTDCKEPSRRKQQHQILQQQQHEPQKQQQQTQHSSLLPRKQQQQQQQMALAAKKHSSNTSTHISNSNSSTNAAYRSSTNVTGNAGQHALRSSLQAQLVKKSGQQQQLQQQQQQQKQQRAANNAAAYSLGTRCGEIFVANNAKQWTFVCTFCNKSTRDIGDFICHIKMKHLEESHMPSAYGGGPDYYSDDDNVAAPTAAAAANDDDYDVDADVSGHDQDYLDCGSYLDINVHTEPDELNYSNGGKFDKKYEQRSKAVATQNKSFDNNWKTPKQQAKPQLQKPNEVVQVLDDDSDYDDDEHNDIEDILETHTSHRQRQLSQHKHSSTTKQEQQQQLNRSATSEVTKARNGQVLSKMEQDDGEDFEDMDYSYGYDGDDGAVDDDDFDNQLLLAPNDSLDTSNATPGSSDANKMKRRQIRGTAYCALCNKTFQYYSLYRNHMIKHSNETPFKCNLCKKGFKSKQAIRYHMNTHQKEKQYKCEICDLGFYTENQFITHILTHENANTYPCMVCGKVLHSDKERELHLTTHNEERPFRCEFCNKLFRLRHHLSNHLKMHRQYRCDYCREEFTSAVHLRKPYACPVCENSPEALKDKEIGATTATSSAASSVNVNPLQLFEVLMPPTECVDLAEMVSDSDQALDDDDNGELDENDVTPAAVLHNDAADVDDDDYDNVIDDDDDEEDNRNAMTSNSVYAPNTSRKKAFPCKKCPRSYSHLSGLNYHLRSKH